MPYKCYTWNFIKFLRRNDLLGKYVMDRDSDIEHKYDRYKKSFNGLNMGNFIYETLFVNNEEYKLVPSNFPYAIESDMQHLLLWFNPYFTDVNKCMDREYVDNILNKLIDDEYVFYKNDISVMSVKDVVHWHIFVKVNNTV